MIHVKFCDIGEVDVLTNDQLKTLPNSFRILPKQALRAKLYGEYREFRCRLKIKSQKRKHELQDSNFHFFIDMIN
jgi:Tudor domain